MARYFAFLAGFNTFSAIASAGTGHAWTALLNAVLVGLFLALSHIAAKEG